MTDTDRILIRLATPADSPTLFSLARDFATSFIVERAAFDRAVAELLHMPDAFLAVAEEDGIVLGYVLTFDHVTLYANGRVAWVEEIAVAEAHRGRGVGRRLMKAAEAWAVSQEAKLIALATRRAAGFYRALGYEESATYFRKPL